MKTCFFCDTEIDGRYTMVGFDRPIYINVFFHKDCVATIRQYISGSMFLENFVRMNADKLEELSGKSLKETKQKSKLLTKGR